MSALQNCDPKMSCLLATVSETSQGNADDTHFVRSRLLHPELWGFRAEGLGLIIGALDLQLMRTTVLRTLHKRMPGRWILKKKESGFAMAEENTLNPKS